MRIPITAVILAGGKGTRMAGVDKGLSEFRNRPMIEHALDAIEPQVDRVLINANRNIERYRDYGHEVIPDRIKGFPGPLAGIHAAFTASPHELLVTLPCDAPFTPADLVTRLRKALNPQVDIALAWDGKRLQVVHALLRRTLADDLERYLAGGGRSVRGWFETQRLARSDFSDQPEAFANINDAEEQRRMDGGQRQ